MFQVLLLLLPLITSTAWSFSHFRVPKVLDPPTNISLSLRVTADQYFEQQLDHFNPTDTRKWSQRYHLNDEFYNASQPTFFLLLGGESEATTTWLTAGSWIASAEEYGALLFYLEHRFYGISQPFEDLSTENLQYLSIHQALEDAANFIEGINKIYNVSSTEAKWIVFGGSYAGTMATWLRQKYQHLVTGAVDSSGPLNAVLDFNEYLQIVSDGMASHSQACANIIKEGFTELEELVSGCLEDEATYEEINDLFSICKEDGNGIEYSEGNEKDLANLFEVLVDNTYAYVVQYNGRLGQLTINNLCDILVNETSDATSLERIAEVHQLILSTSEENCTDYLYSKLLDSWQNTTVVASSMMRQWVYQTCTEFGFFQTTNQDDSIFGSQIDLAYFTDLCVDLFGLEFNETLTTLGIEATNVRYGGTNLVTSNIIHFHGKIDPWHALGKLETTDDVGDLVIVVDDVAHCASMYSYVEGESAGLTEARAKIHKTIGQWLGFTEDVADNSVNVSIRYQSSALSIILAVIMLYALCQ